MDDADGGLSFDFEGGLDVAAPANPAASMSDANAPPATSSAPLYSSAAGNSAGGAGDASMGPGNKRSFRQTVCRHWLRSLCMKGDACGFLHQYDKARMPVCRFFRMYGECREQDCVYKHTNEDVKECNMYKLGFCPNGSDCRYRHAKLPGPPPSVEEVLQKIQHLNSYNFGSSNRSYQQRGNNYSQQGAQPPQGSNHVNQGLMSKPQVNDSNMQQPTQIEQPSQAQVQNPPSNSQNLSKAATPLPQGITRYFIVKSSNRENLELSVHQGVWATQRTNEAKLNEAFDSVEHVILIFSVNRTRNFQGCAKMTSKIGESTVGGNWKHAHGTAHYGRNFSVKWMKLCELSFQKTRHLRNPYNENLPVKISRDCQELEPSIGEQLASLLYLEPDSDLMASLVAAEAKREEEKAKGVNLENGGENPDIVLFEDNEEEEDDESEEEDDGFVSMPPLAAAQGRGRGRGGMWPPNMAPMGRGARPLPGMRGFPPGMMGGGDGFPYGHGLGPDGFPMPDPFGMGPRPFVPFGPRYSGEFGGPGPGMMFPPRLAQPGPVFPGGGYGMMMGPGRGPMMGGMGMGGPAGGNRPMGMPPPPPAFSSQSGSRPTKRDPRGPSSGEWNNNQFGGGPGPGPGPGMEQGPDDDSRQQHSHHHQSSRGDDKYVSGNSFRNNEDSESEDEAPRRSRHKQR